MATISFNVPNEQIDRVIDGLCATGGYSGDPTDLPARREFARGVVREFIRQAVRQGEMQEAYSAVQAERPPIDPLTID